MEHRLTREIRDVDKLLSKEILGGNYHHYGLNKTQIQIIFYLLEHSDVEVCQKDLEDETHLKKASITGTLDSLEEKGIIIRTQSEIDKRKNVVALSELAVIERQKLRERITSIEENIQKGISEEEIETFHNVLEKIKENIKKGK